MRFRDEIGESLTLKFAEAARARKQRGLPILSLGLGEPDFATPAAMIEATNDVLREGNSKYSGALGIPKLRELVATKFHSENGIPAQPSNVVISAGAKQSLSLTLMAILEPGDEVIVISPAFVSFIPQIYLAEPECEVKIVSVDKVSHDLPMDELAAAFSPKTKAILLNSPNNPAGFQFTRSELATVLSLAKENESYLIADEIYEKLIFDGPKHVSVGSLEPSVESVITINGFSKSHALTGWRLGYACLPSGVIPKVSKIQQHINTNTCTFIQEAMSRSWEFDCPHLIPYLEKLRERSQFLVEWLKQVPALKCNVPAAGFFALIDISSLQMSSNDFCASLLEQTGVATTPGVAFGQEWDDHFRLSFAVEKSTLEDALSRISDFVEKRT